jgi:hypothetical protein
MTATIFNALQQTLAPLPAPCAENVSWRWISVVVLVGFILLFFASAAVRVAEWAARRHHRRQHAARGEG